MTPLAPAGSQLLQIVTCVLLLASIGGLIYFHRYAVYAVSAITISYFLLNGGMNSLPTLVWLLVLTGLTILGEVHMATCRAWYYRVSRDGLYGAFIFGFVVMFFFNGPFGFLIGTFLGAIVGELRTHRSPKTLLKLGIGTTMGITGPICFKLLMGLAMIFAFLYSPVAMLVS